MPQRRSTEFIALIAWLTALTALSIDTMLPALGVMAQELGAAHPNDRQFIILGMFAGMAFGNLVFGPLSDSTGRKPAIYAGLVFYSAGALICAVATDFPTEIAGRVLQGFGAASPRVVAISMVRDGAAGDAMARTMSFVMSVFMLVPVLAPSIGQLALVYAGWRWIFVGFVAAAVIAAVWLAARQAETLRPEFRRPLSLAKLGQGALEVICHPVTFGYTLAVGFFFGAFTMWLSTCQQVLAEQYQQGANFPFWFGGMAIAMAISMIINGRFVMKLGMRTLSKWALRGFVVNWAMALGFCVLFMGQPPLAVLTVILVLSFFFSGMTFGNYNAMAMEPMGHIAGMASAIISFVSGLMGVVLGGFAGRFYNGTLTPVALAFFAYGCAALLMSEWAESRR